MEKTSQPHPSLLAELNTLLNPITISSSALQEAAVQRQFPVLSTNGSLQSIFMVECTTFDDPICSYWSERVEICYWSDEYFRLLQKFHLIHRILTQFLLAPTKILVKLGHVFGFINWLLFHLWLVSISIPKWCHCINSCGFKIWNTHITFISTS